MARVHSKFHNVLGYSLLGQWQETDEIWDVIFLGTLHRPVQYSVSGLIFESKMSQTQRMKTTSHLIQFTFNKYP
jgi:hypothetical protein